MKMDVDLAEVKAEIAATKAEIAQAKNEGRFDFAIEQTKYLTELKRQENLLLGQKAATGMIRPYSSYQYQSFHIFLYLYI